MFQLDSNGAVYFVVDEGALKDIQERLGAMKSKAPAVLKTAVNQTARQVQSKLASTAKEKYAVKAPKFKQSMKRKNATNSNPTAIITATGKRIALSGFAHRKESGGESAKAKMLKTGSLKEMGSKKAGAKAFVVTFDSGHVAVVRRYPGEEYSNSGKRAEREAKHWDTTAIKEFAAASVPFMLGNKYRVYGALEPEFESMLDANIDKQIQKLLFGGKK